MPRGTSYTDTRLEEKGGPERDQQGSRCSNHGQGPGHEQPRVCSPGSGGRPAGSYTFLTTRMRTVFLHS